MEVRDVIHGLINYDDTEEKIINSQIFQRLRGIKQLALASLVYPGAHHTRFEHSLGVMYLAEKVGKRFLELDDEKIKILRLAGLLHDIGHGAFSHVSEQIIGKSVDKSILNKYKAQNVQEMLSIVLIEKNQEIREILSEDILNKVKAILQKEDIKSLEKDIISGLLDVDKFDYLLRDSYFAGVKYGTFDIDKVIESLTSINTSREGRQLGIKEEGIYSVEQLLLAKYHMNVQVYRHRLRRITDAMLVRGIEFALEEGLKDIESVYKFRDEDTYYSNFIKYDDETVFRSIISNSKGWAGKFFERLKKRQIFKEIVQIEINDINFDDDILLGYARNPSDIQINNITQSISDFLNVKSEMIIIDFQNISNPTFKQQKTAIDTSGIMVINNSNQIKNFNKISTVFSNTSIEPNKDFIYIYAPIDDIDKRKERIEYIKNNKEKILNYIKDGLR